MKYMKLVLIVNRLCVLVEVTVQTVTKCISDRLNRHKMHQLTSLILLKSKNKSNELFWRDFITSSFNIEFIGLKIKDMVWLAVKFWCDHYS